jgi:hypothetical protein
MNHRIRPNAICVFISSNSACRYSGQLGGEGICAIFNATTVSAWFVLPNKQFGLAEPSTTELFCIGAQTVVLSVRRDLE